jgi:hypothetical protein
LAQVRTAVVAKGFANTDPYVQVPFPDGYGATVHFFWPDKGFQLLGMCVLSDSEALSLSSTVHFTFTQCAAADTLQVIE